jgi:hypothetical protein
MSRAGRTTELILRVFLDKLGIKYEEKPKINGNGEKPDFVIPNSQVLKTNPEQAVILSVKRKVRERWREAVAEAHILKTIHNISNNIWFITLECDINEYAVKTLSQLNMRIYIPDKCYDNYKNIKNTYKLSQLFEHLRQYSK